MLSTSNIVLVILDLFILFKVIKLKATKTTLNMRKIFLLVSFTTGHISEIEGGYMFAKFYCIMFNFHPLLEMTPVVCSRSFGQSEKELKFVTVPDKYFQYIDRDDYRCFLDQCDEVLKKEKKQAVSTFSMIKMWMVYRCFRKYFDTVIKPQNAELTENKKQQFHNKAICNSFLDNYNRCCLCEFLLEANLLMM